MAPQATASPSSESGSNARSRARTRRTAQSDRFKAVREEMDFTPSESHPVGVMSLTLHSYFAQKAIAVAYERASVALYGISVILRATSPTREIAIQAESLVNDQITGIYTQIEQEIERAHVVRNALAGPEGVSFQGYSSPATYELKFYNPLTLNYVHLVQKFDELMRLIDEMWLLGGIDDGQRVNVGQKWGGRIQHLALQFDKQKRAGQRKVQEARDKKAMNDAAREEIAKIHLDLGEQDSVPRDSAESSQPDLDDESVEVGSDPAAEISEEGSPAEATAA